MVKANGDSNTERESNGKVKELSEKAKEEYNKVINKLSEEIKNVKEQNFSKEERQKKLNEIWGEAKRIRWELFELSNELKEDAKDRVKTRLDTLDTLIWEEVPWDDASWSTDQRTEDEKKWLFTNAKDWIKKQWKWFRSKDAWKNETWKNILRGGVALGWFFFWWHWLWDKLYWNRNNGINYNDKIEWYDNLSSVKKEEAIIKYYADKIEWYEDMTNREKRKAVRELIREDKKAEKEKRREERKRKFWDGRFWKFLKWLWVVSLFWWWGLLAKKLIDKWKEKSTDIENKLWKLRWFESSCKELKDKAGQCLENARHIMLDTPQNKEDYEKIKEEVISLQKDSEKVFDEISKSRASDETKKEAEKLVESIKNYVEEIKEMSWEIC